MVKKSIKNFIFPIILAIIVFILFYVPVKVYGLAITSAQLLISADDCFAAYIDGCLIYNTGKITSNSPWNETFTFTGAQITNCLTTCGPHVLAVNYYDTEGNIIRVTYKLLINFDNGNSTVAYSDGNPATTKQMYNGNVFSTSNAQFFPTGWNTLSYDDSAWTVTAHTCEADGCTCDSIADPVFSGTYGGWVPWITYNSGCSVITEGDSNLVRQYFTTPCAPVSITKTINTNYAMLGQTLTYCFSYYNHDTVSDTFNLWDTLPAVTTFVGCNSGCTTQTSGSSTVVSWSITAASNTAGSVCCWVVASSYPFFEIPPGNFFAFIKDDNLCTEDKPSRR